MKTWCSAAVILCQVLAACSSERPDFGKTAPTNTNSAGADAAGGADAATETDAGSADSISSSHDVTTGEQTSAHSDRTSEPGTENSDTSYSTANDADAGERSTSGSTADDADAGEPNTNDPSSNTNDGAASTTQGSECGNGQVEAAESCDDGDEQSGDGCSSTCNIEPGFNCDEDGCVEICGDEFVVGKEALPGGCDDNNVSPDDGCDNCRVSSGWTCENEPSDCDDVDECENNNGGCGDGVECINVPGGHTCGECPEGYAPDDDSNCVDIDECETDNGGCDPLVECDNTDGGRTCGVCPDGYDGDGETGCDPCVSDPSELKLWEVHLGQSDYVMVKNPTECLIELEDLEVIFDDRDDAFGDPEIDCTMRLPEYQLLAGASVRLHEHARPGDISVTDNKITECTGDLPYNPQRGGVTYICDGACTNSTLIDAMAFTGYESDWGTPPAMRFGATFGSPPGGITGSTQDTAHFVRVATAGDVPTLLATDWAIANRSLYASFETAVNVQIQGGSETAWTQQAGQPTTIATDASNAAVGTLALKLTHTGSDGPSTALRVSLPSGIGNPTAVSYFVRTESTSAAAGYFDLLTGSFHATQLSFESTGLGAERENNVRTEVPFGVNTWYQVELRDISYADREFDLYVNRELVATNVEFWSNANSISELRLFSVTGGSVVYYDEIELWQ